MWIEILEWVAFGAAAFSVFLYGHFPIKYGAMLGMFVAILFTIWAIPTHTYAALVTNLVFFSVHLKNFLRHKNK